MQSPNEYTRARVAGEFIAKGDTKVYALKGGWWKWIEAKYPLEKNSRKNHLATGLHSGCKVRMKTSHQRRRLGS